MSMKLKKILIMLMFLYLFMDYCWLLASWKVELARLHQKCMLETPLGLFCLCGGSEEEKNRILQLLNKALIKDP